MLDIKIPPTIVHMLERNVGKIVRVIIDPAYGFEGTLIAVTQKPAGIWISEVEAVVLRATLAQPIPQVADPLGEESPQLPGTCPSCLLPNRLSTHRLGIGSKSEGNTRPAT